MSTTAHLDLEFDPTVMGRWFAVTAVELLVLWTYLEITDSDPRRLRYLLYPFVWINAGVWAVAHTRSSADNRRHRWLATTIAICYFLLVMAVPGKVGIGSLHGHLHVSSLRIAMAPPGWGPIVAYAGIVRLYLVPFEVVGYLSLSYLVYANALRVTRGTLGGALGLVTCVGCTVPLVAPVVGLLGGAGTGLATTAYAFSYDFGTALFVLTLGILYASHRRDHR